MIAASFDIQEIASGLLRWTYPHPEWRPNAKRGSAKDWPQLVGSVACELPSAFVFVDALVPHDHAAWRLLDERVAAHRQPVFAVTTIPWHRRSRDKIARRYDATVLRANAPHPKGMERVRLPGMGESMVWLPEHRALITGDRLLGDDDSGLRLCPDSWLGYLKPRPTARQLRVVLADALRGLPVEMVLVAHGVPLLTDGRQALDEVLAWPASTSSARAAHLNRAEN